jgi:hypothetical protein
LARAIWYHIKNVIFNFIFRFPEIAGDLNLDNVVHFRNKEVVVYPDEANKPEIGHELNRFAEVCLDLVWPVDRQRKVIKVCFCLFGFLDKLLMNNQLKK